MKKNNICGWLYKQPDLKVAYLEDEIKRHNEEARISAFLIRLHETKLDGCINEHEIKIRTKERNLNG
jgi:hypothetical protein